MATSNPVRSDTSGEVFDKPRSTSPYSIAEYIHLDGKKVTEKIIGVGGTGLVFQQGQYAVKIPYISRDIEINGRSVSPARLYPQEGDYDIRPNLIKAIQNEKAIYRRLGKHPAITRCHNHFSTDDSIQMDRMDTNLRCYLNTTTTRPNFETQLSWSIALAHTLAYIHSRRVIVSDISSNNIVLDAQFAVKFIDFSESTLMPLEWDLHGSDDLGFSILTDIGQFGAVIFEPVTGVR